MSFSLSEYTKIDVGCGFAYSAPPDPLNRGPLCGPLCGWTGMEGREALGGKRGREGKG